MRRLAMAALVVAAAALAGCTHGKEFARPDPDSLVLGQTDRTTILTQYGEPIRRSTLVVTNGNELVTDPASPFARAPALGTYETIIFRYADTTGAFLIGNPAVSKVIAFDFWNDKLVAYNFISSFEADSSNFNEAMIQLLEKGRTTKAKAADILGAPTGRTGYPTVQTQGDEKFIYQYIDVQRSQRTSKRLEVLFGADGVLKDYRFASDTQPVVAPAGNTYAPVYIPPPRRGK
jgi:hypothetical protein